MWSGRYRRHVKSWDKRPSVAVTWSILCVRHVWTIFETNIDLSYQKFMAVGKAVRLAKAPTEATTLFCSTLGMSEISAGYALVAACSTVVNVGWSFKLDLANLHTCSVVLTEKYKILLFTASDSYRAVQSWLQYSFKAPHQSACFTELPRHQLVSLLRAVSNCRE